MSIIQKNSGCAVCASHNDLFIPRPRGRGILVAPGFLVGAKTQKQMVKFFGNINMTFLATWGCASDFYKMLPKFKMAARGQQRSNFVGAKT